MNKIALLAAAALCVTACHAPQLAELTQDLEDYGLTCNVKSVKVTSTARELDYLVEFNRQGLVKMITSYQENGKIFGREEHLFDESSHLSRINNYDTEGQCDNHIVVEWDGDFVKSRQYWNNNSQEILRWEYDNDGTNTIATRYYEETDLVMSTARVYDGLSMTEKAYDKYGVEQETAHVQYWAKGKLESLQNDEDSLYITYSPAGLPVSSTNTVLDSRGNYQWVDELSEEPERTYTYEFDSRGNWIKRTEYSGETETCTITREIRY